MKYYQYKIDIKKLNFLCTLLFIPLFIIIFFLRIYNFINITFLVLYFLWMFLHEFLHGIGFSLSKGINHKNIVYGACLEKGIFYCMCKEKISKSGIIISLLFPFFFIGVFTYFLGLIINSPILILLSLFNIVGCVGDLAMFFAFIKLPDFRYLDLDDCTGFTLISQNDLSNYRLFGINLEKVDDYKCLGLAKDYRKFTFSKLSLIIFVLMIVFLFIDIVM